MRLAHRSECVLVIPQRIEGDREREQEVVPQPERLGVVQRLPQQIPGLNVLRLALRKHGLGEQQVGVGARKARAESRALQRRAGLREPIQSFEHIGLGERRAPKRSERCERLDGGLRQRDLAHEDQQVGDLGKRHGSEILELLPSLERIPGALEIAEVVAAPGQCRANPGIAGRERTGLG